MKASALGAVLLLIGLIVIAYGFSRPFDFLTPFIGFCVLGVGLWILAEKFRQWVREH